MTQESQGQASAPADGDVLAGDKPGQSVLPKEATGTAKTKVTNDEAKDWRKSDKEWQQMVEDAQKGKDAATQLERLKDALGLAKQDPKQEVDVVTALTQKVEALEMETARAKWEKDHPAVGSPENREKWEEIIRKKGHLVKSGDLTYDELWSIIRKDSTPSPSVRDYKEQELSLGSVPVASKSVTTGSEIDPDVAAVMRKAGYTDEQIRMSA